MRRLVGGALRVVLVPLCILVLPTSLAIAGQSIIAWGSNGGGQLNSIPTGTFSETVGGSYCGYGIRTDGTLAAWGSNGGGQLNSIPTGTFSEIVGGSYCGYGITAPDPAILALGSSLNCTVITGGTGSVGTTVTNSAVTGANNLNYILSGSGTLGSASGTVAPGSSQPCTVSVTSTDLGINTVSLTASDPNASNSPQTTTATLTVLDHSNASLSSTATQTSQTINFGNVLRGATIPGQTFTIYNRAANTSAAYTANLKLTTGFTTSGDSALTTNLSTFNGLAAGSGTTCTASLNTSNYTTTGSKTVTMSASQLVDDSTLSGAGNNNSGDISITLQGNVGNATADASNSDNAFGSPLTASVVQYGSYANLESMAKATTGSGGYDLVGSKATILAGTNSSSSSQTVSMQWRTQTLEDRTGPMLVSDVLHLIGMTLDGTDQTSPFVLQMNYNPALLPLGTESEETWASNELVYLGWRNASTGRWTNAIDGNFGTNMGGFHLGAWPNGDMTLGDYGVNTSSHTVWAVLDHNSDFGVVPANVPPGPGDANDDGYVDDKDASILGAHWQTGDADWSMGDFNDDHLVNDKDAAILAAHWTGPPAEAANVPEPTSLMLLLGGLGIATSLWRKRKAA
ncbi:MAG: PEP-CTERM sorting domain-containing protein [Planctomycetia bacterium]|nr:PEP-CTERM sorting domain-containing protein [Planctomycetia bacterium]